MENRLFERKRFKFNYKEAFSFIAFLFICSAICAQEKDWRNIDNAISAIPDEGYCDQPYSVINSKGEWVVVLTTGMGLEGQPGQHVVSTISKDRGKTWSPLVDIEPATGMRHRG